MTEIQRYEDRGRDIEQADPTGGRLVAWAMAANAANQLAKALVQTSFVPKAFVGNIGDGTAAVLMGDELGLSPLAALRSIYVVHGSPALYARAMVALVQSRGHEIWTEMSTAEKVIVCGRRRNSQHVERATWTIARARQAGYTTNAKYASNPEEMLYAKGAAEVCRKVGADVLAGIPFSVEDLELDEGAAATTTTQRATTTTKARRKLEPVPADDPPLEPTATVEPADVTDAEPASDPDITDPQMKLMHVLFNREGITDRAQRIAITTRIIGRPIESSNELTIAEAGAVLDALETGSYESGDA